MANQLLSVIDVFAWIGWGFIAVCLAIFIKLGWLGIQALKKRRYLVGAFWLLCCSGMLMAAAESRLVPGFGWYHEGKFCSHLIGRWMSLPDSRFSYASEREFNGDGYSIDVIDMPDGFWSWLKENEGQLMAYHPKKPEYRSKWNQVNWHQTPIKEDENRFLDFAVAEYAEVSPQLKQAHDLLRSLALSKGSLIAYCHNSSDNGIGDIDFYLLNPQAKVFILVNHNT